MEQKRLSEQRTRSPGLPTQQNDDKQNCVDHQQRDWD
jgi:hypothetical protein